MDLLRVRYLIPLRNNRNKKTASKDVLFLILNNFSKNNFLIATKAISKNAASGSRFDREVQLYEECSEHRRPNIQWAADFCDVPQDIVPENNALISFHGARYWRILEMVNAF